MKHLMLILMLWTFSIYACKTFGIWFCWYFFSPLCDQQSSPSDRITFSEALLLFVVGHSEQHFTLVFQPLTQTITVGNSIRIPVYIMSFVWPLLIIIFFLLQTYCYAFRKAISFIHRKRLHDSVLLLLLRRSRMFIGKKMFYYEYSRRSQTLAPWNMIFSSS